MHSYVLVFFSQLFYLVLEGSFYMGILFPPIAFLYLLHFYICIYIFILYIGKKNY